MEYDGCVNLDFGDVEKYLIDDECLSYEEMYKNSEHNNNILVAKNKQLKDKVNELTTKLVAYEQMHDRAISDIQEYSKALEIACGFIKRRDCPDSDFMPNGCKVESCDGCFGLILDKARKEIAND